MQHRASPPPLSPLLSHIIIAAISPSSPPHHHQRDYEVRGSGSSLQSNHPPPPPFSQLAPCVGSNHKNRVMDAGWGLLLPKEEGMKSRTGEDRWVGEEEISSEEMKCRVDWSVSQSHSSLGFGGGGGLLRLTEGWWWWSERIRAPHLCFLQSCWGILPKGGERGQTVQSDYSWRTVNATDEGRAERTGAGAVFMRFFTFARFLRLRVVLSTDRVDKENICPVCLCLSGENVKRINALLSWISSPLPPGGWLQEENKAHF